MTLMLFQVDIVLYITGTCMVFMPMLPGVFLPTQKIVEPPFISFHKKNRGAPLSKKIVAPLSKKIVEPHPFPLFVFSVILF